MWDKDSHQFCIMLGTYSLNVALLLYFCGSGAVNLKGHIALNVAVAKAVGWHFLLYFQKGSCGVFSAKGDKMGDIQGTGPALIMAVT